MYTYHLVLAALHLAFLMYGIKLLWISHSFFVDPERLRGILVSTLAAINIKESDVFKNLTDLQWVDANYSTFSKNSIFFIAIWVDNCIYCRALTNFYLTVLPNRVEFLAR